MVAKSPFLVVRGATWQRSSTAVGARRYLRERVETMKRFVGVLGLLSVVVACGATSSNPKDAPAAGAPNGGTAGAGDGEPAGGGAPLGPPAQGAVSTLLKAASPPVAGKSCPAGAAVASTVPTVTDPSEALDEDTYVHRVIDGEEGATVACRVAASGTDTVTLQGSISQGGRALRIDDGLTGSHQGAARITIIDTTHLASPLTSPASTCVLDFSSGAFQIKAGSVWGKFTCPSVESAPSDYCAASGVFVLENCDQE